MPQEKRKLILITGIPGTGKTFYGKFFADKFGFTHYDLEDQAIWSYFLSNPSKFIEEILGKEGNIVATWGFVPNAEQIKIVNLFRAKGFKLVWFDGNRQAALREYKRKKGDTNLFDLQIRRIEDSKVISRIMPLIVNTFDASGEFKDPIVVLDEIEKIP